MCSVYRIADNHVSREPDATSVRSFTVLWHRRRPLSPTSRPAPTSGRRSDVDAVLLFSSVVTNNVRVFGVSCEDDIFPLNVMTFMRVSEVLILWCLWILLLNLELLTILLAWTMSVVCVGGGYILQCLLWWAFHGQAL